MADQYSKSEVSRVSRYGDITWGVKFLTLTTPLSGKTFFGRVGRAMVSQCTKYEVFGFTGYEAVNGGAKCRKWGGLGWLGGTQGHGQCHHSIERIRLPIRL